MKGLFLLGCVFAAALLNNVAMAKPTYMVSITDSNRFIRLQLAKDLINRDETVIIFKNKAKSGYNIDEDARYLQGNGQVRLFSYADQTSVVFNTQPFPATNSATRLNVFTKTDGTYSLKLPEVVNVPPMFDIWLVDNFMKDSLDFRNNPSYSFNVSKADTNTFGGNRFKIIIKRNKERAAHLLSFTADKSAGAKQVIIKWRAENDDENITYIVEHSTDKGKTYTAVDSLKGHNLGAYSLTDHSPGEGLTMYRLKQRDFTGNVVYSAPITVSVLVNPAATNAKLSTLNIYPNPVANQVNISMNEQKPLTAYNVTITNLWGLKVKEASSAGPQWQGEVSDLKPGIYMVTITGGNDNKVVGYNKFLKK